jgi:hypothetical protein
MSDPRHEKVEKVYAAESGLHFTEPREIFVAREREHAEVQASIARVRLNHRLRTLPEVETTDERHRREVMEQRERIAAESRRREAKVEREVREARQHELAVARTANASNGSATVAAVAEITAVLPEIHKALDGLINRIERIERRLEKQETSVKDALRRVEFNGTHLRAEDERMRTDFKEMVDAVKAEVGFLRLEHRVLRVELQKRPPETTTQHIVVHQGS